MLSPGSEDAEQGNNKSGGTQQNTNEAKFNRGVLRHWIIMV
jgi:hypothetical protein